MTELQKRIVRILTRPEHWASDLLDKLIDWYEEAWKGHD